MKHALIVILAASALTACGGGSDSQGGEVAVVVDTFSTTEPTPSDESDQTESDDSTTSPPPSSDPDPDPVTTPDPVVGYYIDTSNSSIELVQDWNAYPDGEYTAEDMLADFDCPETNTLTDFCHNPVITVESLEVESGRLKLTFDDNEVNLDNGVFMQKRFPAEWDELYLTYEVEYDENFDQLFKGGKILGLGGTAPEQWTPPLGGAVAEVDGGFSTRFMFRQYGQLITYIYHQDKETGDDYGERNYVEDFNFEISKKYIVEMRVVMNDPGESNGYVETRINGQLMQVQDGYVFSESGMHDINTFIFNISTGGATEEWMPANSSTVWIDDLVVSTESVVMEK